MGEPFEVLEICRGQALVGRDGGLPRIPGPLAEDRDPLEEALARSPLPVSRGPGTGDYPWSGCHVAMPL